MLEHLWQEIDHLMPFRNENSQHIVCFVLQGSNVMEDQDLREIGITDPSHRKKILHAARSLPKVTNH